MKPPDSTIGSSTTVTKDGVSQIIDSERKSLQKNIPLGVPTASVGISVSAGMNTEYGQEKIEVSAWCTLPCMTDTASIERTFGLCYELAEKHAREKLDLAGKSIFPHLYKD